MSYRNDPNWIAAQKRYLADYSSAAEAIVERQKAIQDMYVIEREHELEGANR